MKEGWIRILINLWGIWEVSFDWSGDMFTKIDWVWVIIAIYDNIMQYPWSISQHIFLFSCLLEIIRDITLSLYPMYDDIENSG